MSTLLISGDGPIARALTARHAEQARELRTFHLSAGLDDTDDLRRHLEAFAASGERYADIYIDLTEASDEFSEFEADLERAVMALEGRLRQLLRALKYGAQHMARADGGRIWVLCYDHSVDFCVAAPSNPVTNHAAMAAVQCVAKEVRLFGVLVNLFLMHPPVESVELQEWRQARDNLHVYQLKYKPQTVHQIVDVLDMYAALEHLSTTGGVIPVGSGISTCNI